MNHLSFSSQKAFLSAEAASLQEPDRLDCDVCAERNYQNREMCGLDCTERDKWDKDESNNEHWVDLEED